jgi:hypothetical protein
MCSSLKRKLSIFSLKSNFNVLNLGSRFVVLAIYKLANSKPFFGFVKNQLGISSVIQLPNKVFLGSIVRFFYSKSFFLETRKNGFFLKLNLFKAGDLICNIFFNNFIFKF